MFDEMMVVAMRYCKYNDGLQLYVLFYEKMMIVAIRNDNKVS